MKKSATILRPIVMLFLLVGLSAPQALAVTINVPADQATIQAAITAAAAGDTINVAAGTYTEDLVIAAAKANLNLVGAGAGTTTIKGVASPDWTVTTYPTAVPNIDVQASGVKIHGFTIESPNPAALHYSSGMLIAGNNVEIYDNVFRTGGAGTAAEDKMSNAIQTWRDGNNPIGSLDGLNIHNNTFESLIHANTAGYDAIFINHTTADPTPTDWATIADNTFSGVAGKAKLFRGITTERSKVRITGNTIVTELAAASTLQGVNVLDYGDVTSNGGREQRNVTISGNIISGFNQDVRIGNPDGEGANPVQVMSGISINNNRVAGGAVGLRVRGTANGVTVVNNSISGTSGNLIENEDAANMLIAEGNWLGSNVEATITAKVLGMVDFTPWLGGSLAPVTWDAGDAKPAGTNPQVITFVTSQVLPASGKIAITYPAGFAVGSAALSSTVGLDGNFTVGVSSQVVTIDRSGGTDTAAGVGVSLTINGVSNKSEVGTFTVQVATKTSAGANIDTGSASKSIGVNLVNVTDATDTHVSATASHSITFTTSATGSLPGNGGRIFITFPDAFNVSGAASVAPNTEIGGFYTVAVSGQTVILTRTGSASDPGPNFQITVTVGNIVNASPIGDYSVTVGTKGVTGNAYIDGPTPSATFHLGTQMDGITATPSDNTVNAAVTHAITLDLSGTQTFATDSKIAITYPSGFNVTSAAVFNYVGIDGNLSLTRSGQTLTLTRSGGLQTP
ncbi:MAG: hypothetical protein HY674_00825, partial [Chloroflexi bacterium]|nr:hypothetical protein [Chloroflexota bacterium]